MTQTNYSPDLPVETQNQDRFQRFNFSKRIAETIINRNVSSCIVIGIYGSWGEGKTSVLNFIAEELVKEKAHVVMKFNPWRYKDEQTLLTQFFYQLANSIDVKLKNNKEKVGELLKKYGSLVSFEIPVMGNIGQTIEKAGGVLDLTDTEQLKARTNKLIEASGKRITIMIDDIDRLDKEEIHAIFRIVKLTADFSNTSYVLSFDERMVAAALGERFGDGTIISGQNFLEKIIQVPLRLPMVRPEIIQKFSLDQIKKHLSDNSIQLHEYEMDRFLDAYKFGILARMNTPRVATRYSNTLSFSIPLLNGEVNIVDLMIIEAIKIFYPAYYNFVRYNADLFLGNRQLNDPDGSITEFINQKLYLLKDTTNDENGAIQLLKTLFPILRGEENFYTNDKIYYKNQCITSPHYFERYFTYAVIIGDLSDLEVKDLLITLDKKTDAFLRVKNLVELYSMNTLLSKISVVAPQCTDIDKISFCCFMAKHGDYFTGNGHEGTFEIGTMSKLAVEIINEILLSTEEEHQEEYGKVIIEASYDIDFLTNMIEEWENDKRSLLRTKASRSNLFRKLAIKRIVALAKPLSIFKSYPLYSKYLWNVWTNIDFEESQDYLKKVLNEDETAFIDILNLFVENERKSTNDFIYLKNLRKSSYEIIELSTDVGLLVKQIKKMFTDEQLSSEARWIERGETQDLENLTRQFLAFKMGTAPKVDK